MADTTSLVLAVDSRQVRTAAGDLDKLTAAGTKSEKATAGVASAFSSLKGVFAGLAAADLGRRIIQQGDAYTSLNARIGLVTKSTQEFAKAQRELFNIAQSTGTGLEQTADLYGSLSRSTEELGFSQERVLGVTRSINQAIVVSGGSAQAANAALVQLGQGFASGTLRGEELNSVMEQTPRLAKAIADGLGITTGQLRQLGQDGKLTGEAVFQALERSSKGIEAEFSRLPLTVERASTQASNALLKLIGTLNQTTDATGSLAGVIQSAAGFFSDLADQIDRVRQGQESASLLANAFVTAIEAIQVFGANVKFVFQGVGREIGAIAAQVAALARLDISGFRAISDAVKEDGKRARAELDALERRMLNRVPLPDLGQSDPRELARRGRGGSAFGSAQIIETSPKPGRTRAPRAARDDAPNLSIATQLQDALNRLEGTDLNKITRLRDELTQLLELKAGGSTDFRLDAAIADVTAELEKMNPALAEAEERQKRLNDLIAATPSEQLERVRDDIRLLNDAYEAGKLTVEQYGEAVNTRLGNTAEKLTETKGLAEELGLTFTSALEDAIVSGKGLRDILSGIADDILRITTRKLITEPFADAIGGAVKAGQSSGGGGLGAIFSSVIAGLFGGGRAGGGPVGAGRMYQVNENGPELLNVGGKQFLMMGGQSGSVTPNGGRSVVVNNSFTVSGQVTRQTQQQLAAMVGRSASTALSRGTA